MPSPGSSTRSPWWGVTSPDAPIPTQRSPAHALFQLHLSLRLSPGGAPGILCGLPGDAPGPERPPAGGLPLLLRLGRALVRAGDDRLHSGQLRLRPLGPRPEVPGEAAPPPSGLRLRVQPGAPFCFQVSGLYPGKPEPAGAQPAHSRHRAAHRHLLFHLPGVELRPGRGPGGGPGPAEPLRPGALCLPLPPAHRRAHRQVLHRGQ